MLSWVSIFFLFAALLLTIFQLVRFSRTRDVFPFGMEIGGIKVGGLTQQGAADRLFQAYSVPVEIHYGDAVIQAKPAALGFELDLEGMIAAADAQRISQQFWSEFWDYLWNRLPEGAQVPLRYSVAEDRLRSYLTTEIAAHYDQPPAAAQPVPGSTSFQPGKSGTVLDINRAVLLLEDALKSPSARIVNLSLNRVTPPRASFQNLQVLLKQVIDVSQFDGLVELYLLDLQNTQEIHFAYRQGKTLQPDVAFTAASTIKIPIMVSAMRRLKEPLPAAAQDMLVKMIELSENDSSDALMREYINKETGPLEVSKDMQTLGYKNTFLAGYFFDGAPLLKRFTTPANQRTDLKTNLDPYNQTTPAEMGQLLNDIYQCSETGGGSLVAVFPGEFTQSKCKQMINYLILNKLPNLISAGLPEGTQIAHKHGWITDPSDGLLHNMTDASIVYTPGGNFVLTVYVYTQNQLLFEPGNRLFANLAQATYNYFNQSGQ
jgi:beta-lactamase class A